MKKLLHSTFYVPRSRRSGTTLFELILVIAIISVLSLAGLFSLFGRAGQTDLSNTTQQITALLREARSRSVSQASSTGWGVHFENPTSAPPSFALFYSDTYSASTTIGYYKLPGTLAYGTSSIPEGSSKDVKFNQISGTASASTSVTIYLMRGTPNSSTINVASSGIVSF